jgi:hypothetical protein
MEAPVVDVKSLEIELNQAREARLAAQAASSDVEDMIWQVQHLDAARPRFAFFVSGFEQTAELG